MKNEEPATTVAAGSPRESSNDNCSMKKEKTVTIIVEGTPHEWPKGEDITYEEVVTLEVPDYAQHPEITYSVMYTKGHGNKPEGTLSAGGSVKVKERMVFNVSETNQS